MAEVLRLEKISKSFGELQILREVDFVLNEGETIAIVGPSGAGKSTLLHVAGLMERPTSGQVFINSKNTSSMDEALRAQQRLNSIGFLFQFHHLLPDFNLLENVLIPARLAGDDLGSAEDEAVKLLRQLGIENRMKHKPHELSGGEQQRAALARALIRQPKLLLCDEPTGNLDLQTARNVTDLIFQEVERTGVAAIVVTHNEQLAKQARAAYHLSDGKFQKLTEALVDVTK